MTQFKKKEKGESNHSIHMIESKFERNNL